MDTIFLKIYFTVFWSSLGIVRFYFKLKQRKNKIKLDHKTTLEKVLLFSAQIGMMMVPFIYIFTPWLDFANYKFPNEAAYLGISLIPFTLWLFYRAHKDLGKNWSPSLELIEEHALITNGVYKKIRHPMYSSIWLWVLIQFLMLHNYVAGLLGIITFGILYFLRVDKEEEMMLNQFGDLYRKYMEKTNRLTPFT
jgi:protein-S-isoprenylcysteine O-methyltransferase Ste14